jgi:spore germination cell wall hydrolase CwlJ-like protein
VIKNRADHPCSFQGRDIVSVCYFPAAFSCYLATDGQYVKAVSIAQAFDVFADPAARPLIDRWTRQDAQALRECWEIFKGVIAGEIPSPFETDDVFMYYAAGTKKPFWADKLVFAKQIGGHLFYRGR